MYINFMVAWILWCDFTDQISNLLFGGFCTPPKILHITLSRAAKESFSKEMHWLKCYAIVSISYSQEENSWGELMIQSRRYSPAEIFRVCF